MARDGNLRAILRQHLPDGDWVSIETGAVSVGVPDSNYCFPGGIEGWIEGKRTHAWKVAVRPGQIGWMARRSRRGGRCFVMVRRLNKRDDEIYVISGRSVEEFSRCGLTLQGFNMIEGKWSGGPSRWDWAAIRRILTQPLEPEVKPLTALR